MSERGQRTTAHQPKVCENCHREFYKLSSYSLPQWNLKRFCSNKCRGEFNRAAEKVEKDGRVKIWSEGRFRWRYHVVAEAKIGRALRPGEVVDHVNGDHTDDRPENLRVFASHAEHMANHWREGTLRKPPGIGGSVAVHGGAE